jgi:adenylyltransferase/sulfurtransferase
MPNLKIPTPLRPYASGQASLELQGGTVAEILTNAVSMHPELQRHLYNEDNQLRPYVNLFLGEENIKELKGLETELNPEDTVLIIPSIAGG